jgi:hypothetical protein
MHNAHAGSFKARTQTSKNRAALVLHCVKKGCRAGRSVLPHGRPAIAGGGRIRRIERGGERTLEGAANVP